MNSYFAVADETGDWDFVGGHFGPSIRIGVAWVVGSAHQWERALQMAHGGRTALEIFTTSFAERVPTAAMPKSHKYHVRDVVGRLDRTFQLEESSDDAVVEELRSDICWLLGESGLGVIAADDIPRLVERTVFAASRDGMHVRAIALASLFDRILPFIPADARLVMAAEGRTESTAAEATGGDSGLPGERYSEPFRQFAARLGEEMRRLADRARPRLIPPKVVEDIQPGGRSLLEKTVRQLNGKDYPFLRNNAGRAANAMLGMADLAASLLAHRSPGGDKAVFPEILQANLWLGSLSKLAENHG